MSKIYDLFFNVVFSIVSSYILLVINLKNLPTIIIDPGHGGFDPGGGSNNFFKEKDKNLQISKYQKARFDELGIPSALVRDEDITLNPNDRISLISNLSNNPNNILISNHINSGSDNGGEVIYSIRGVNTLPKLIASNLSNVGLPIRNVYTRVGRTNKDYYFILRQTPFNNAMIIEYGFATDEKDTKRLLEDWNILAEAVVKAIADYLEVPYSLPKTIIYNVLPNDSLYKIAKKFNTTIDKIKNLNSLFSDSLQIGQTLIIPNV